MCIVLEFWHMANNKHLCQFLVIAVAKMIQI